VQSASIDPWIREVLEKEQIEQVVSIPLNVKGRLVGALQLGARRPRTLTPEELNLLSAIGQQVGVAVENARLHEAIQKAATLEERARLARELHDSVTQSLYSVTLLAEAVARMLSAGDYQTAVDYLRELRDTAQESLREMRLLIFELRPVALEKSGLTDALRLRLEAVESRSGLKTELHVEGLEKLPYEAKIELYHIAQESLNNILKHAHARKVQINLQFLDRQTCLEVIDDGDGLDPKQAARGGGLGLPGIAERAEKIGGKLHIDSAPGKGTRVRVEVGAWGGSEKGLAPVAHHT
jgi:signal transduction histidine kinase